MASVIKTALMAEAYDQVGARAHQVVSPDVPRRRGGDTRGGVDNAGGVLGAQLSRTVYEQFTRK